MFLSVKNRFWKKAALLVAGQMLLSVCWPSASFALTSGPSQPEVQSFEPIGTTEMVDLFTGDFTYNIPLFDLPGPDGGYPFNLAYQSNVGMDQEASWVGLGWTLNPGAMTRQVRGLPDDFNGDMIKTETHMKQNITAGIELGGGIEFFGKDKKMQKANPDASADDITKTIATLNGSISIYYNNYRGMGYAMDLSGNINAGRLNVGLNGGIDSQEGLSAGANAGFTLATTAKGKHFGFGLGMGYSSLGGLNSSLQLTSGINKSNAKKFKAFRKKDDSSSGRTLDNSPNSSSFGFPLIGSDYSHAQGIDLPMKSSKWSLAIKGGAGFNGIFLNGYIKGFFSRQKIKGADGGFASFNRKGYGFMNMHEATAPDAHRDMSRERDGVITKESPNMSIPYYSYDIYQATAQGMGGVFRAYRSDIGIGQEQGMESTSETYGLGIDIGVPLHIGGPGGIGKSVTRAQAWTQKNEVANKYKYLGFIEDEPLFEPYYFRAHGEATPEYAGELGMVGGKTPVRIKLQDNLPKKPTLEDFESDEDRDVFGNAKALAELEGRGYSKPISGVKRASRKKRMGILQPVPNKIAGALPAMQVSYKDADAAKQPERSKNQEHIGGFYAVAANGLRYIYALPAYNTKEVQCQFSVKEDLANASQYIDVPDGLRGGAYKVKKTNHYYNRVETPAYTYAHLLTSVLGADYVDADDIPGPSDGDLGYWVKFNYQLADADYAWRAPFYKANYARGMRNLAKDDMASYTYGTKEVYYLESVETKTHIAFFQTSPRNDGRGAWSEYQNAANPSKAGGHQHKLDAIRLFTKAEYKAGKAKPVPIKEIGFSYDYSLCGGVDNNLDGGGKLTLKSIAMKYGGSAKGELNPYYFTYDGGKASPNYHPEKSDRWGSYKPYNHNSRAEAIKALEFPYTDQDPQHGDMRQQMADAWALTKIDLPSGASIEIDYEMDDYAFVQDRPAMQMFHIAGVGSIGSGGVDISKNPGTTDIFFKLERPIPKGEEWRFERYFDGISDLKFRIMSSIAYYELIVNRDDFDYVSGYASIESKGLHDTGESAYEYGRITLKKESDRHPFAVAAWQYIRQSQPEQLGTIEPETDTESQIAEAVVSMASPKLIFDIIERSRQYYKFASGKGWGKEINLSESLIRLNSPDLVKYGGGHRVRQVTLFDRWQGNESVYGQAYRYTKKAIIDGREMEISSGVASNEPFMGGDENALRRLKERYSQKLRMQNDNVFSEEYPTNEAYYPSASVGYSQVTVMSLASAYRAGWQLRHTERFPKDIPFSATGATVNEFYTAKDFPTLTDETEISRKPYRLNIPLGPLGNISVNNLTASQGYSIILNDMHGRPSKVSNYEQLQDGSLAGKPKSSVEYVYATDAYGRLDSKVPVLRPGAGGRPEEGGEMFLGQDHEFVVDMRETVTTSLDGAIHSNADGIWVVVAVIPAITVWPSINASTMRVRTATTNKIIFQSGVLKQVKATDGQSNVTTENLLWDAETGEVLLSKVSNNFDEPIYSYSIPAYYRHEGMGLAYKNVGMRFKMALEPMEGGFYTPIKPNSPWAPHLVEGDEFIIGDSGRAIYAGKKDNKMAFHIGGTVEAGKEYDVLLYRSGRRNMLGAKAESITTMKHPIIDKGNKQEQAKTIVAPK